MKPLSIVGFILTWSVAIAQSPVDVAESTLKIGGLGEEVFYYGFAEGDQLIFNFTEVNGKELKEVEITELPSSSKYMDFKTRKIENKNLFIARAGIYKFRFTNSAIGGRICKFKIQRIPASFNTQRFNTNVYWRSAYDTSYTLVQERYLVKSDTLITQPIEKITKVSSQNALNGNTNKTVIDFTLPEETVSWSYYIGVGREGQAAYEAARDKFVNSSAAAVSKIAGYGTMAALAIYGINTFSKVQGRDNVKYWFIPDWQSVLQFQAGGSFNQYKQGDVINEAAQMKAPLSGPVYIGLFNDNMVEPIEVVFKVTAVQVKQQWATRTVNQPQVTVTQVAYLKNE